MTQRTNILTELELAVLLAWKDCVVRFQSPVALVFVILLPLAMVNLTGLAFKGFEPRNLEPTIALEDNDGGEVGRRFREAVEHWPEAPAAEGGAGKEAGARVHFLAERLDPQEARRRVRDRELGGLVVLPAGLSQRVQAGEEGQVQLVVGPRRTLERSVVEVAVDRLVSRARERDPLPLQMQPVAEGEDPRLVEGFSSYTQAVAGNGVMFILLNCIMIGGMAIVREREQNTLDRLLISPMSSWTIFLGKVLGVFLIGAVQALVVFGFGVAVGVALGSLLGVVLVTFLFILVGCSLALAISSLSPREQFVQDIGAPVALLMTALGGGMFPFDGAPAWLQTIALLFPTGWAMRAYHKLMWEGQGWTSVLPELLVLAGFAAVFFVIGSRALRRT